MTDRGDKYGVTTLYSTAGAMTGGEALPNGQNCAITFAKGPAGLYYLGVINFNPGADPNAYALFDRDELMRVYEAIAREIVQ